MRTVAIVILGLLANVRFVAARPPASIGGDWTTQQGKLSYRLHLDVSSTDSMRSIDELDGSLSVSSTRPTTATQPTAASVTGQYFSAAGVVVLNFRDTGSKRSYAIGDATGSGSASLLLRTFRLRSAIGIQLDSVLRLDGAPTGPRTAVPAASPSPVPAPSPR